MDYFVHGLFKDEESAARRCKQWSMRISIRS
jgi:hypothetical protein